MRILHLISSAGFYGAESMLLNLAKSLKTFACSSVIGVFDNSRNPQREVVARAQREGVQTVDVSCRGRLDFAAVRFLRAYLQEREINVIHTHGYKANLYGLLASRGLSFPIIATCHNWTRQTIPLRIYALLDVLVLRNFSKVVAVSNDVAKRLRAGGVHEQRVIVIPNGVEVCTNNGNDDRKASHGFSAGGVVVGAVGRLVPEKGFQYLLQCAPEVLARFPEAKFLLVGDGPLRTDLENLARKLGISSRVIFTGEREDMRALYDRMDIFVLPSLNEGMPMSVLEAMAAMKPVIGTAVGGVPTVVIPEQTGLLVKPADPAALVDAISRLIGDSKLRGSLAEKAQRLVIERYSSREMASKYCSLYHEIARIRLIG